MRPCLLHSFAARFSASVSLLVAPLAGVNVVKIQRLLRELGTIAGPGIAPGRDIGIVLVIALCFTVRSLILLAKVASARFIALAGIDAHQFTQLEEVRDAAGLFQTLVQVVAASRNVHVLPVFLAQ